MSKTIISHRLSISNQLYRFIWYSVWLFFVRPLPRTYFNSWKIFLLRLFGAKVSYNSIVYSTAKIYMPNNLIMEDNSCLGPNVDCYNVDIVHLKMNSLISQKVYLCTASHNVKSANFELISAPIVVEENAWVAADSYIGMGVTIGKNSVVGARSSVFKNISENVIVGGNPAKYIKNRF